jgi:acetyl-CoA/propionyl-CoA carboxylase carboxyl transferase subunit
VSIVEASGLTRAAAPPVAAPTALSDPRDPRTRLAALLDGDSFAAMTPGASPAVLAGSGQICAIPVVAFATDARIASGALSRAGCT